MSTISNPDSHLRINLNYEKLSMAIESAIDAEVAKAIKKLPRAELTRIMQDIASTQLAQAFKQSVELTAEVIEALENAVVLITVLEQRLRLTDAEAAAKRQIVETLRRMPPCPSA